MQRYLRYFDWLSFLIIILLCSVGLIFIFSATYTEMIPVSLFLKKQIFGVLTGILIYLVFSFIDYRILAREIYITYFLTLGLLIFTIIKGHVGMGAQRWINLWLFKFQPSELIKLCLPAFFTYYFVTDSHTKNYKPIKLFVKLIFITIFTSLLILKQPDLGTAIVILLTSIIMLWLIGIGKKFFSYSIIILSLSTPIIWKFLKPYQKKRIEVFLGGGEKTKERYQIEQSKIAIGSGGLLGKGLLKGTQNILRFLPESRTDFIFSVICEEWGFIGALFIIFLYCLLFFRNFYLIRKLNSIYAKLLATGLLIHILISTIINIAMVIGLLPIVGIPLPLISYGITNIWITLASLGWINGIYIKRHVS
jgi:rod shape determining protein RodA